ncbi:MAG: hypothetical protein HFH86_04675 [Bacilli bacterium]|jgi:uncharacterized protein YoxC|nr:hypothetical protein [Bacilli bacterium]
MSFWLEFLPIVIYILLIIILIVGIILGIRFIVLLGKAQRVVDDLNRKVRSLDGLFHIIDTTTDKIVLVTDKVVEGVVSFISKIFMKSDEEEAIIIQKEGKRK